MSQSPDIFLHLLEAGQQINELILGGTLSFERAIKVTKRAYIKPDQVGTYQAIISRGCKVTSQYVPQDDRVDVAKILDNQKAGA